jgi:sodium/bile acid cotransporter 7
MKAFLVKRWFLIALFVILVVGTTLAPGLKAIAGLKILRDVVVAAVLFCMAWPLQFAAMRQAVMRPGPPLLAVGITFGLLPCFARCVSLLLNEGMAAGLLVAAVTPCTLASASVWTRRAGGNDAVSILVTIITNLICFVVTPLWLVLLTGQSPSTPDLSVSRMTTKLGLLVLLPMALAQATRANYRVGVWATAQKVPLGVLAQCGILCMLFVGSIQAGLRLREAAGEGMLAWDLLTMLAAVVVVHVTMLWTGVYLARWLHFSRQDQIAVAFACSQKTLTVGLLVAMSLQVSILPMVTYHISQLLIDTLIADRFRDAER